MAEAQVVGTFVVTILSFTAIVRSESGRFCFEDVDLGEILTNALTVEFFSEMISLCVERERWRSVLTSFRVILGFMTLSRI